MLTANTIPHEALKINDNIAQTLGNLKGRWQDEKGYEDFNDYVKLVKIRLETISPNATFLKLTKAFTLSFKIQNCDYTFEIKTTFRSCTLFYKK